MNPRGIFSFILGLVLVGVLVGLGVGVYQAGVAQGIVDAGRFPAGATVPVAGYGYGHGWGGPGFGLFGLLFGLFFLFLLFGLARAAFSRGRGWGPGGPGGHGWGGPGWGRGYGPGFEGPEGWREERERRMAELHRRLHEDEAGHDPGTNPGSGSAAR